MRAPLAQILLLAVGGALPGAVLAADPTPLARNSPFTPAGTAGPAAAASDELYEFAGVSTIGKDTTVNIFQKSAKKGRWIAVGDKVDGISVTRYDPARDQVVIRVEGGGEKVLALRKASPAAGKAGSPPPVATLPVAFNPAPPLAVLPPAPEPTPVPAGAAEPSSAVTAPAAAPAVATPPPAPGSVAHQEQEARMLVSDLLEIGMAQRKAYDEAQAKAAQPPNAAPPAPAAPPAQPPPAGAAQQ